MVHADAEVLRRRLYAPGASAADVERYRALGIAPHDVAAAPPAVRPDRPVARRIRPAGLLLPATVLAVLVGGTAAAGAAARAAIVPVMPVVAPATALAVPAADRKSVREALASRDDTTVAGFLVAHRAPPALATARRSLLVEQTGAGTATVGVDPGSATAFQGRATVLLVLDRAGEAGWTTFRRRVDPSGARTLERQEQRRGRQEAGALTAATFRYGSGDQPVEVRVDAPAGVRWGVEVVFTD